jgi:hypothetical protein
MCSFSSGVTFYVHPLTAEARWSLSPRSALAQQTDDGATYGPSPGDDGWIKVWDEQQGLEYYYNEMTGASQWDRPPGFVG